MQTFYSVRSCTFLYALCAFPLLCVSKRLSGCGSGTEYLAVTPWGDLYPCHQFVGQEEFLMGNVDEGITHTEIADEFRGCSVYSKESCKNCFARFYSVRSCTFLYALCAFPLLCVGVGQCSFDHDRTFNTFSLHLATYFICIIDRMIELIRVRHTAAAAIKSCETIFAAFF